MARYNLNRWSRGISKKIQDLINATVALNENIDEGELKIQKIVLENGEGEPVLTLDANDTEALNLEIIDKIGSPIFNTITDEYATNGLENVAKISIQGNVDKLTIDPDAIGVNKFTVTSALETVIKSVLDIT